IPRSPAVSYIAARDRTMQRNIRNFIVMAQGFTQERPLEPYVLPHELMHILLNAGHRRGEPNTALFNVRPEQGADVDAAKRIGPYPDAAAAQVGNDDTFIIRRAALKLPQ